MIRVRGALLLVVLAMPLVFQGQPAAQIPAYPPDVQKQTLGTYGLATPPVQQPAPTQNSGPPTFGAPRPDVGVDQTAPQIRRRTDCPVGYETPRDLLTVPHLVVCIVKQVNLAALHNVVGPNQTPASLSSMPPILERTTVNQCAGRPAGSYACGRGGTECCGPHQDNMCFAGAYACYVTGTGKGPKTACCMTK